MIAYEAGFAFCAGRFGDFFLLSANRLADSLSMGRGALSFATVHLHLSLLGGNANVDFHRAS